MEISGTTIPAGVMWLLAAVLLIDVLALADLARHDVRHLPKWAWALVMLLSFPAGVIVYFVVGRVADDHGAVEPVPDTAAISAVAGMKVRPATGGAADPVAGPDDAVVVTRGLTKVYGDTAAVDSVDLTVPKGSTYGLIGPNGAGKTTLLSILAGLRRPTRGTVELAVSRQAVGVLVDTPQFEPWLTAREVVDLARHLTAPDLGAERVEEVVAEVGLSKVIDRRTGGFSRGMLQRLGLAACLVGDPQVLLLDEPSSALDPAGRREVLDLVGRLAHTKTVILSTHILSDVQQVADVVGVMDQGRLQFQGPLGDLLARTASAYVLHVSPAVPELVEQLQREPWAQQVVEHAPGRIHLVVSDAAQAERALPRLLAGHPVQLKSFNPATDLETAFLELTR